MIRKNKKNCTCKDCGKSLATPQKLRQHYKSNKNQCRSRTSSPVTLAPIVEQVQVPELTLPEALPALIHEPEPQMQAPTPVAIDRKKFISQEEADRWVNPNERKPGEHFRTWGARLLKRWNDLDLGEKDRPENLRECGLLCHDLEQYDFKSTRLPTKEECSSFRS